MKHQKLCSRRRFLGKVGLGAACLMSPMACRSIDAAKGGANRSGRPNILFILADDLGWMDSTVYGSRYYETPNLEKLAQRGMLFRNAYAANPLCSPTRASIMTGKYPCRLHLTTPAGHLPPQPDVPLMAKQTAPWRKMVTPRGKRFLPHEEVTLAEVFQDHGYTTGFIGKWHLGHEPWWPKTHGFEVNIAGGHYPGPPSYFSPYRIKTLSDGPPGEYITDRLTDEAEKYIKAPREKPFFLCFWHYAVHAPFQGKEDLIKRYENRKDPRGKQDCPTMAAMIQSLDESVGRIMAVLDEQGLTDNTIIIFMSDNGGNMYDRVKGTTPTNNAPLRNGKGNIYEGGVRTPCMVVWPGKVKPGVESDALISSIDFYPTVLAMAGIPPNPEQQIDGESLVPVLREKGKSKRQAIYCHFPHYIPATGNLPATSLRQGPWKLIRFFGEGPGRAHHFELYNLDDDVGETKNLAAAMPERVKAMDALITAHLADTGALIPFPNPVYDPEAVQGRRNTKPVAGFHASGDCGLSVKKGRLVVTSTGGDPYFYTNQVPGQAGDLIVTMRYQSTGRGEGQFFWATRGAGHFHRSRRITFEMVHDNQWHEVSVPFNAAKPLTSVRVDPGTGRGRIIFERLKVQTKAGRVIKEWVFK